jgi:heptosyltransferase-1
MKVLFVKLSSLGDVIQTIPVVADLKQAFPDVVIDWVVEEAFAPLVERVDGLRCVMPMAGRRWRQSRWSAQTQQERRVFLASLQSESYDAVIDFQGLIKSALVARQARLTSSGFRATYANASELCGYEWPVRFMLDRLVPMPRRIHAVARYRALAAGALGYQSAGGPLYPLKALGAGVAERSAQVKEEPAQRAGDTKQNVLPPQLLADKSEKVVVFAHGTTRPDNEWAESRWLVLGQRLVANGYRIGLPQAGGEELALAHRLAQALGPQVEVWPKLSLAQVLDRMADAAGVVGVDSGLSHMAVALDLPHVQIFSQPRAWRAGPVDCAWQKAVGGEAAPDVDTVWQAWQDVVAAKAK